ncbi:MAG: hypothetical protein ACTMIK_13470, partial [Galactobacter sp.]
MSEQDFRRLHPLNKRHRWLVNRVSAARMIPTLAEHSPAQLCTVFMDGSGVRVTRLPGCPADTPAGPDALLHLLHRLGSLRVRPVGWGTGTGEVVEAHGSEYRVGGRAATEADVLAVIRIMATAQRCVISENVVRTDNRASAEKTAISISGDLVRVYL